jgi:cyclopropane-fatty-acyl-phospholipid synthase
VIYAAMERGWLPDWTLRAGIRALLRSRLRAEGAGGPEERLTRQEARIAAMNAAPVALNTADANRQHYEVPTAFFERVLGKHMKYSSGYWHPGVTSLDQSEADMLALTCERADLQDGQRILDLGCGWGSFSLYAADRYPHSEILAVSNSRTQREHIEAQARARGLGRLRVITQDMNAFAPPGPFDRIVSVEMFEHMRNHRRLLETLAGALANGGALFLHIFVHREFTYFFEVEDQTDWMAEYFFTGGMMPGAALPARFQEHLRLEQIWGVEGTHYQKTLEAWLARMDAQRQALWPLFVQTYGAEARRWWNYWRVFFLACSELFGFDGGREWFVMHYRFRKPGA